MKPESKETPAQKIKRLQGELSRRAIEKQDSQYHDRYPGSTIWDSYPKKVFTRTIWSIRQKSQVSLSRGCRLFGISRQAVYQAKQRAEERAKVLTQIKPLIQTARMQMPKSGTRKLYFLWKDHFDRMQKKTGRDALSGYLRSEE